MPAFEWIHEFCGIYRFERIYDRLIVGTSTGVLTFPAHERTRSGLYDDADEGGPKEGAGASVYLTG